MDFLTVYEPLNYTKKRIGTRTGDGGYVVIDGLAYDLFVSCGLSDNIDFEIDFLNLPNNAETSLRCVAYDGTPSAVFKTTHDRFHFIPKNIGPTITASTTNLHHILSHYRNVFLKMDIESFEFRWLQTLTEEHLKKIRQLVIEFHMPFRDDIHCAHFDPIQLSVSGKCKQLQKLAETHWLVHFHPNNSSGFAVIDGIMIPNVFECTYVRKGDVVEVQKNTREIPDPVLDAPNHKGLPEIRMRSPPFVWGRA